ncbi:MAG TPA: hypothetical protein VF582_05240 [Allosphingosinicella sp.]|jgi:hypothetical protein
MIGKVARMMAGRTLARKRGYSAHARAVAGLLAPFLIKRLVLLAGQAGGAAADARRRRRGPKYLSRAIGAGAGIDRSGR